MNAAEIQTMIERLLADAKRLSAIHKRLSAGDGLAPAEESWAQEMRLLLDGGDILAKPIPPRILIEVLGIAQRTLFTCRHEGMPAVGRGEYMLAPCTQWYIRRQVGLAKRGGKAADIERAMAKAKLLERRAKAALAQMDKGEREGALVDASQFSDGLASIGRVFRSTAEAIERIHGLEVGRAVREMIDAAEKEWEKLTATGPEEKQEAETKEAP